MFQINQSTKELITVKHK